MRLPWGKEGNMIEMDIIYRLSILVGFLLASVIAMLIAALVIGLHHWCKTAMKELGDMVDELETEERKCLDESKNT